MTPHRRRSGRRMLVCLDGVAPAFLPSSPVEAWLGIAAGVLDVARSQAWRVVHVRLARGPDGEAAWRSVPELLPLPSEPVFQAGGQSIYSCAEFAALATAQPPGDLMMVGISRGSAALASAIDALTWTPRVTIVIDALRLAPYERRGLDALADLRADVVLGQAADVARPAPLRLVAEGPSISRLYPRKKSH